MSSVIPSATSSLSGMFEYPDFSAPTGNKVTAEARYPTERTPKSPTIPMQIPAPRPEHPVHSPAAKWAKPLKVLYEFSRSLDGDVMDCPMITPTISP